MSQRDDLKLLCENAVGFSDVSLAPDVVLGLLAELDVSNNVGRALGETLESVCESRDALARVVEQMKIEAEALGDAEALLGQVNGDQLPAINSNVLIHLGRRDAWVKHTVVGYYAWKDLGGDEHLHRVFIRVRDADGYLNARLLKDVRADTALGQGEQS